VELVCISVSQHPHKSPPSPLLSLFITYYVFWGQNNDIAVFHASSLDGDMTQALWYMWAPSTASSWQNDSRSNTRSGHYSRQMQAMNPDTTVCDLHHLSLRIKGPVCYLKRTQRCESVNLDSCCNSASHSSNSWQKWVSKPLCAYFLIWEIELIFTSWNHWIKVAY
jgi:hypothetical protein